MIMILHKSSPSAHPNEVDCEVAVAHDGLHGIGKLHFPNKITWSRFAGAIQRGAVGMRDFEVRIDASANDEDVKEKK